MKKKYKFFHWIFEQVQDYDTKLSIFPIAKILKWVDEIRTKQIDIVR